MKPRVLLIYPPVTVYGSGKVGPHPPLGLAYIAAWLEKYKYEVKIVDALAEGANQIRAKGAFTHIGLTDNQIKKAIIEANPAIVGISVMFTAFAADAFRVAKIAKEVNKKIRVVIGGAHVSIDPKAALKDKNIDFAIQGEGEIAFLKLLKAIESGAGEEKVAGLTFRKGKKIFQNPPGAFIKNLDVLPFPARHLLPMHLYGRERSPFVMRNPSTGIVSSRGCPGRCVYCSIHAVWGHSWRGRSAKNVVDEIEILAKEYGIREIHFQDDSVSVDRKRLMGICDEIIKRKIDVRWTTPNGIAHWTLDEPLLRKMKKSGCYRVTFGIESGNLEMRRWVGKPYSLEQARRITLFANRIGMWTLATNIIGFPYESKKQIDDTIKFAVNSDVDFALFYRLGPRPGTPVYDVFKSEGWLPKNEEILFSESVSCRTKYFKENELYAVQNEAYRTFFRRRAISFLNPVRIGRKIHNLEDMKYVMGLIVAGIKMIFNFVSADRGVSSKTLRV